MDKDLINIFLRGSQKGKISKLSGFQKGHFIQNKIMKTGTLRNEGFIKLDALIQSNISQLKLVKSDFQPH